MDTNSFLVNMKTDNNYKEIAEDVETRYDTSNYVLEKPLAEGKNQQVIGVIKDK